MLAISTSLTMARADNVRIEEDNTAAWASDEPPAAPTTNKGCAWVRLIYDWKYVSETEVHVRTSPSKWFAVTFNAPCRDAKDGFSMSIMRSGTCLGSGDTVAFRSIGDRGPFAGSTCFVKDVTKLDPKPK
ncbi:MAG TPA: hypothetical protein DCL48_15055 [Alphaproteobacteria bacterium]|nr:hypothetical protein [Alphaproteobacteria bacterium]